MTFDLHEAGPAPAAPRSWKDLVPSSFRLAQRAWRSWLRGEPELHLVPGLCDPARWSLDVGANNGVYSFHMARASAGVMAFEPQPRHVRFLRQALGAPARVEQVALSDAAGEVRLRVPRARMEDGRATIEPANRLAGFDCDEIRVPCRRLDDYRLPAVGMIKIDVEGHELSVIEGARERLARDRPNLLIEAEERHRPQAVASLCARLRELGYAAHLLGPDGLRPTTPEAVEVAGQNNLVFLHASCAETVLRRCRGRRAGR